MPTPKSIAAIKKDLLNPSLTSQFEVEIAPPPALTTKLATSEGQKKLNLLCSQASLPGTQLSTQDITDNYHGVTEKHAHRRLFDDRLDLTFYCDAGDYTAVRFFENWIGYISGGATSNFVTAPAERNDPRSSSYFYRMRYPQGDRGYMAPQGLIVRKFEKDYSYKILQYEFINSFPLSIQSMELSYDTSDVLKVVVSMCYIRYILSRVPSDGVASSLPRPSTILDQSKLNSQAAAELLRFTGAALPQGVRHVAGQIYDANNLTQKQQLALKFAQQLQ